MRFHPQSPFGKAWATHFKEANLARLSDEEKRVEYNRFSAEWEEKMGRGSTLRQVHSA
jgi:DnaJ-class molecular chaperone